jgi:hypothetical protein
MSEHVFNQVAQAMADMQADHDQVLAEVIAERDRLRAAVVAALALTEIRPRIDNGLHTENCHRSHVLCLAAKIRAALAPVTDPGPHTTNDKEQT